jgi:hypothetical protein
MEQPWEQTGEQNSEGADGTAEQGDNREQTGQQNRAITGSKLESRTAR